MKATFKVLKPIPGMGYQMGEEAAFDIAERDQLLSDGYIGPVKTQTETATLPKAETATTTKKK